MKKIGSIPIVSVLLILTMFAFAIETGAEESCNYDFNYEGECEMDRAELTEKEKAALPYVMKYAIEYHISPVLIMAMIAQESSFNPKVIGISRKGAKDAK